MFKGKVVLWNIPDPRAKRRNQPSALMIAVLFGLAMAGLTLQADAIGLVSLPDHMSPALRLFSK